MDLTGKSYGRLVACSEVDEEGRVLCLCSCGNVSLVRYSNLLSGRTKSCGCLRKETVVTSLDAARRKDKIGGTSIGKIKSSKIPSNNKSGAKGVWYNEKTNKYEAYIYFKGRKTHLGSFGAMAEAVGERLKAENDIFAPVIQAHAGA